MVRLFWQTLKVAPVVFTASLLAANGVKAQQVSAEQQSFEQTLDQINNDTSSIFTENTILKWFTICFLLALIIGIIVFSNLYHECTKQI